MKATEMKRTIYLDNCCFNRPYDDQSFLSIYLETQAKLEIQELVKDNCIDLAWSFILDFENGANPDNAIKDEISGWRNLSSTTINKSEDIISDANMFFKKGFGKKDALHLACAIFGRVDYFITVDKGILKRRKLINNLKILTPIEFIGVLEEKNEN